LPSTYRRHARIALVALVALSGCIRGYYNEGGEIPWERVEWIEAGQTTRSEILEWFGAPQNFSNPAALTSFMESNGLEADSFAQYPFTDVFVYQLHRGYLVGIAAIFYNRFDLRIASDTLLILFDAADRVRHIGVRRAPPLDP
jgi:hypothetical protein